MQCTKVAIAAKSAQRRRGSIDRPGHQGSVFRTGRRSAGLPSRDSSPASAQRNALLDREGSVQAAHLGLDPAGRDDELGAPIIGAVSRVALHQHVKRGLARSVEIPTAFVVGDAAQFGGHGGDSAVRRDDILEDLDQPHRAEGVDEHHVEEVLNRRRAGRCGDRLCDPGIDEQHVDRAAIETLAQRADAGLVGDVCGFLFKAAGKRAFRASSAGDLRRTVAMHSSRGRRTARRAPGRGRARPRR